MIGKLKEKKDYPIYPEIHFYIKKSDGSISTIVGVQTLNSNMISDFEHKVCSKLYEKNKEKILYLLYQMVITSIYKNNQ